MLRRCVDATVQRCRLLTSIRSWASLQQQQCASLSVGKHSDEGNELPPVSKRGLYRRGQIAAQHSPVKPHKQQQHRQSGSSQPQNRRGQPQTEHGRERATADAPVQRTRPIGGRPAEMQRILADCMVSKDWKHALQELARLRSEVKTQHFHVQ